MRPTTNHTDAGYGTKHIVAKVLRVFSNDTKSMGIFLFFQMGYSTFLSPGCTRFMLEELRNSCGVRGCTSRIGSRNFDLKFTMDIDGIYKFHQYSVERANMMLISLCEGNMALHYRECSCFSHHAIASNIYVSSHTLSSRPKAIAYIREISYAHSPFLS